MGVISDEELLPFYSSLMGELEWDELLHSSDITSARLRYKAECFCVECKGLFPRTSEYWKVTSTMPYRLGTGMCLRCIAAIKGE